MRVASFETYPLIERKRDWFTENKWVRPPFNKWGPFFIISWSVFWWAILYKIESPDIISQVLYAMKIGCQWIFSQVILIWGLTDKAIFWLNEWIFDSASEIPTHSAIYSFIDVVATGYHQPSDNEQVNAFLDFNTTNGSCELYGHLSHQFYHWWHGGPKIG